MHRLRLTLLTSLAICLAVGSARAQQGPAAPDPASDLAAAQAHFQGGRDAYTRADYATAVREFKAAQAIRFSSKLDFNIASAYEKWGGHPHTAAMYYRRYLEYTPDAKNRDEVTQKIQTLEVMPQEPSDNDNEGVNTGPPPPPQQGQAQPQYQYDGQGQPPPEQAPPPAKPRSKYWWVWIPIVGGAVVLTVIVLYAYAVASTTTTYYGAAGLNAMPQPGRGGGFEPTSIQQGPVLFRF